MLSIKQATKSAVLDTLCSEVEKQAATEYNIPATNLYVVGFGVDTNGNSVIIKIKDGF